MEDISDQSIIMDFLSAGFNITPDALMLIKKKDNPSTFVKILLNSINCKKHECTITRGTLERIDQAIEKAFSGAGQKHSTRAGTIDMPTLQACAMRASYQPVKTQGGGDTKLAASTAVAPAQVAPTPGALPAMPDGTRDRPASPDETEGTWTQESVSIETGKDATRERAGPTSKSTFTPLAREHDARVKVLEDCTSHLKNEGEYTDFHHMFDDRFEKLKAMFRGRKDIPRIVDIADLPAMARKVEEMHVCGMIVEKRTTKSGNLMLEIDDKTGIMNVILPSRSIDQKITVNLVEDEVLCFKGFFKDEMFIANDMCWPDVKRNRSPSLADEDLSIVLISDLHVGSDNHLSDLWDRFKRWMNGDGTSEKARELAGKIKYVSIAGDLIDGVGVYPTQEDHLTINDVYDQLERAAQLLQELPDHLTFIISPGSHEPVRRALPQPAIQKSYAKGLYELGAIMVSDPALVETHGIKTMLYHGESIIDLSLDIPEISNATPELAMKKLLMSRHLAPTFGKKTELAPDRKDWLVIQDVPDILHTGHVHCNGVKMHRGTWLVNSGCFQGQTDFMKGLGIVPTPGQPNIVNLKTFQLTTVNLMND